MSLNIKILLYKNLKKIDPSQNDLNLWISNTIKDLFNLAPEGLLSIKFDMGAYLKEGLLRGRGLSKKKKKYTVDLERYKYSK